jgi:hypothetical protein
MNADVALAEFCARHHVPGAAVATFDAKGSSSVFCFGTVSSESSDPVTPATVFRIYSVAKLLTAMAVVRLSREGVVDLDAPLDTYLLDLTRRRGDRQSIATTRQALSHTSGPTPDALTWAQLGRNDDDLRRDVVRDYHRALSFAQPGRHYGYNNWLQKRVGFSRQQQAAACWRLAVATASCIRHWALTWPSHMSASTSPRRCGPAFVPVTPAPPWSRLTAPPIAPMNSSTLSSPATSPSTGTPANWSGT